MRKTILNYAFITLTGLCVSGVALAQDGDRSSKKGQTESRKARTEDSRDSEDHTADDSESKQSMAERKNAEQRDSHKQDSKQENNKKSKAQDRHRQQGKQSSESGESDESSQSQYRLRPFGWVTIATDYDNDGRYDGSETIYYYDLVEARKRSSGRSQQDDGQRSRDSRQSSRSAQQDDRQADKKQSQSSPNEKQQSTDGQPLKKLEGKITLLRQGRIGDSENRYTIARIRTDDGRSRKVNLGPKEELSNIDMVAGDHIAVLCREGRIHGQTALIAQVVKADGQTIDVREATERKLREDLSGNQDSQSSKSRKSQDDSDKRQKSNGG